MVPNRDSATPTVEVSDSVSGEAPSVTLNPLLSR